MVICFALSIFARAIITIDKLKILITNSISVVNGILCFQSLRTENNFIFTIL